VNEEELAALYVDKLVILDPISASWATIGADRFENPGFRLPRCELANQTYGDAAS